MKKLLFLSVLILTSSLLLFNSASAQAPSGFTYQSVLRDANNDLIINTAVGTQISILQTTAGGTAVYVETHAETTNANGLLTLQVGAGSVQSGTFANIDWSAGPYFVKAETDPAGGATYTITGTQQMMSVPYALYAITADRITSCDLSIGDIHAGGIVFYLDGSGCHGLVSKELDEPGTFAWSVDDYVSFARARGLFAGAQNTKQILYEVGLAASGPTTSPAATQVSLTHNGYSDWYIPSIEELHLMYINLYRQGLGNFVSGSTGYYLSSSVSEVSEGPGATQGVHMQPFDTGFESTVAPKYAPILVRAVRGF
jgi:hypothetical protein